MNIGAFLAEIAESLKDFLYPPSCPLCGTSIPGEVILCSACRNRMETRAGSYDSSGRNIEGIDAVCALLPYDADCRTLVHDLKYHGRPSVGLFFGELLGEKAVRNAVIGHDAIIVPVPLHPAKFRERGYNQSERIACGITRSTGCAVDETLIGRSRKTPTQTALDADERARNVSGAFRYIGGAIPEDRTVVLVDDVLTTGSTLSECAKALREGGAKRIVACVAATPAITDD